MTTIKDALELKRVPLARTGERVSEICLGCMVMGSTTSEEESFKILDHFYESGGNFLDTANCYAWWVGDGENVGDESEAVLGKWITQRGNRDQVFLATKVGGRLRDPHSMRNEKGEIDWNRLPSEYEIQNSDTIRGSVEGSLRRLKTDYIDLYYAHIMDDRVPLEETLEALNALVVEGKVRYIACSNFSTWKMERARQVSQREGWAQFVAIQQQYSYLRPNARVDFGKQRNVDEELLDYLRHTPEVALVGYSPLLKGMYDSEEKRQSIYLKDMFESEDSCERLERIRGLAKELGVLPSQVVFAWLLRQQPRVIPILGSSRFDQYLSNLQSVELSLSDEQIRFLNEAGK